MATVQNPVIESAEFVYKKQYEIYGFGEIERDSPGNDSERAHTVEINVNGVKAAARYISQVMEEQNYCPQIWRENWLHLVPPVPYCPFNPDTRKTLDWIFLVSALNFSFWSELEDGARFGVEWYTEGWDALTISHLQVNGYRTSHVECAGQGRLKVWNGYWSLLAAVNKALEKGIPIIDPAFYSCPQRCPDSVIRSLFSAHPSCREQAPLLEERIKIMREVGTVLCKSFGGSYQGFLDAFEKQYGPDRTALQLVQMVVANFESFRDENLYRGRKVFFWKRAQILVADTWAAFHPCDNASAHPLLPNGVGELTMFADYRVPQILHDLGIISYSSTLRHLIESSIPLENGSIGEMRIRAASILAVDEVVREITKVRNCSSQNASLHDRPTEVTSALVDFFLWELAKKVENGEEELPADLCDSLGPVPIHRTRSIWY